MRVPQSSPRRFASRFERPWAAAALVAAVCCSAAGASSDEVAAAREAEEQWERVPVVSASDAAGASPVAATEDAERLRFDPGTAALTPATRASLDRLAARLRAESAGCRVDLRPVPSAALDLDLVQKRAAAVRRYLSRQQGIAGHRISERAVPVAAAGSGSRCVLVAHLG